MAYNKVILDGSLGAGVERWSVGLKFSAPDGSALSGTSALNTWADGIRTAFATANSWSPSLLALLGSNGALDRVRCYYHPFTVSPAASAGQSIGGSVPGTGSLSMPPQCSLVVSLTTGVPGRRTRGRFYWPHVTGTISAGFKKAGTPTTATLSAAFAQMLRDVANIPAASNLDPVVVSEVGGGTVTTVTAVSVGDVIDTQRRRRDGLIEVRTVSLIP